MKSAIKDVLNGKKGHMESIKISKNKETEKLIDDAYEELKGKLSPELLNLHQKFVDALDNSWV